MLKLSDNATTIFFYFLLFYLHSTKTQNRKH